MSRLRRESSRRLRLVAGAILALGLAGVLSACSPTIDAEYASYDSLGALEARADELVEVRVESSRQGRVYSSFEGEDPETNPYAGAPEQDRPSAEEAAVDVVVHTVRVTESYKGGEASGGALLIAQNAGEEDIVYLAPGETFVLFLLTAGDGPAGIVGGNQGQYRVVDGQYRPADSEEGIPLEPSDLRAIEGAAAGSATPD